MITLNVFVLRQLEEKDSCKWDGEDAGERQVWEGIEVFMLGPVKYEIARKHPSENVEVAVRQKSLALVRSLG